MNKIKSRKLIGAVILFIFAVVSLICGKTTEFMQLSSFLLILYGLFVGGNIGKEIVGKMKDKK
jgi:hypothetical protein